MKTDKNQDASKNSDTESIHFSYSSDSEKIEKNQEKNKEINDNFHKEKILEELNENEEMEKEAAKKNVSLDEIQKKRINECIKEKEDLNRRMKRIKILQDE